MKTRAAVLLDIDETLLDFHTAEAAAIEKTFRQLKIPVTEAVIRRYSEINKSQWERLEEGLMTREEVLIRRFEILFEELGMEASGALARDTYEGYLCQGHWFVPGAEELLAALYGRYPLYIISNGTGKVQYGRMESAGIRHYFERVFISEELGANKPEKAFFDRCFAAAPELERDRCLVVGDSLTSDIRGGRNAGIRTCWFNPKGLPGRADIVPDDEIRSLLELPPLLERIFPET